MMLLHFRIRIELVIREFNSPQGRQMAPLWHEWRGSSALEFPEVRQHTDGLGEFLARLPPGSRFDFGDVASPLCHSFPKQTRYREKTAAVSRSQSPSSIGESQ